MDLERLRKLVGTSRDSAMLRLTLARLLAEAGDPDAAAENLEAAVAMDSAYTAAWKELGRVRRQLGDLAGAESAWTRGIEEAQARGDKQAEREMTVFLKRLRKPPPAQT
jgi:predicted Zn-dependent protease